MTGRCLACAVCLLLGSAAAFAQPPERKRIDNPRVDSAPTLDDYASGTGPGTAVTNFLQREPGDLTPITDPRLAGVRQDQLFV